MYDGRRQLSKNQWNGILFLFTYEYYKPGIVHNGVEPMSNGEHCPVSELTPNRLLNEFISFQVHRSRGFVQDQDLTFTK